MDIDSVGSATEAGLYSKAVEPKRGGAGEAGHDGHCLNCGTPAEMNYCPNCGQKTHLHRSLGGLWHDFMHGVLHLDGKLWRTLPLLIWQPGKLIRRYVHGQRAEFVSPLSLFLFAIFLMFVIFSFTGGFGSKEIDPELAENRAEMEIQLEELAATQSRLEETLAAAEEGSEEHDTISGEIDDLKQSQAALRFALRMQAASEGEGFADETAGNAPADPDVEEPQIDEPELLPGQFHTGTKWLDKWFEKIAKKAQTNPELMLYKLKSNGYKFAWLLVPLSIPFVWLVMIGKRGLTLYDHAVLTTYSLAFMTMLFTLIGVSMTIFEPLGGILMLFATFYIPFHIYRSLRHAYELSRAGALLRSAVLLVFIQIVIALFFSVLLMLGALG